MAQKIRKLTCREIANQNSSTNVVYHGVFDSELDDCDSKEFNKNLNEGNETPTLIEPANDGTTTFIGRKPSR